MILDKTIKELERAFEYFNKEVFGNELETPIITIQTSGKSKSYAWCTTNPTWENEEKELKYEINLSAEFLSRSSFEICHSLIHEMCHLYNNLNGIKDVSGRSHNKKFKETAERFGLNCEKEKPVGWGITKPTLELANTIKNFKFDESTLNWQRVQEPHKDKEPITMYKYECEECDTRFTIKYDVEVKCKECGSIMHQTVKNPKSEE